MIICRQASAKEGADQTERRRGYVYAEKRTDPEHHVSNADLPGMYNDWGVCIRMFAPAYYSVKRDKSFCPGALEKLPGFLFDPAIPMKPEKNKRKKEMNYESLQI